MNKHYLIIGFALSLATLGCWLFVKAFPLTRPTPAYISVRDIDTGPLPESDEYKADVAKYDRSLVQP